MPVKLPPDTSRLLLCPMPGLVVSIAVVEGQDVKAGETLADPKDKVGVLTEWLYRSLCIELSTQGFRKHEQDTADRETSLVLKKVFETMKAQGKGLRNIASDLALPVEELHRLVFGLTSVSLGAANLDVRPTPPRRGHLQLVR